jgi:hypothetical protein
MPGDPVPSISRPAPAGRSFFAAFFSRSSSVRLLLLAVLALFAVWCVVHVRLWDEALRVYEQRLRPVDWTLPESPRQRVFLDSDPCYWLTYAAEMVERGAWRLRATSFDNAPYGREMHWSQAISWLLVLFGWGRRLVTGEPWAAALENGAIWVNPALHLLFAAASGWLLARRLGLAPALIWLTGLCTAADLPWAFHPLRPDHHSLHILFTYLSVILLAVGGLGWISSAPKQEEFAWRWWRALEPPDRRTARRCLLAAGLCGGLGLWTGATVQLLTLGAVVAAALFLVLHMPVREEGISCDPDLWLVWARTGAATSLVFYLVEYAGAWTGLRLEVNSPLHAVAWWSAGELLARLARNRMAGGAAGGKRRVLWLWSMGMLLLPAALIFGPPGWHVMHDPGMQRLHNFIHEFFTFPNDSRGQMAMKIWTGYGLLPLVAPAALWLSGPRWSRSYEWGLLWVGFALSLGMAVLAWQQVRWLPFLSVALLWLAAVVAAVLARHGRPRPVAAASIALILVAQATWSLARNIRDVSRLRHLETEVVQELTKGVLTKHLCQRLDAANEARSFRFMADPDIAGPLYYYGRIPSVASFYWENRQGNDDAVAFFADPGEVRARAVARARGLTHLLLPQGQELARAYFFMREGFYDDAGAEETLLGRLARNEAPAWLSRDRTLTRIGHARYRYGPGGIEGAMTVYRIEWPENGEDEDRRQEADFPPPASGDRVAGGTSR